MISIWTNKKCCDIILELLKKKEELDKNQNRYFLITAVKQDVNETRRRDVQCRIEYC